MYRKLLQLDHLTAEAAADVLGLETQTVRRIRRTAAYRAALRRSIDGRVDTVKPAPCAAEGKPGLPAKE